MKRKSFLKVSALFLSFVMLLSSCVSTTLIQSNPSGAQIYLNGESSGVTPYTMRDTKIVGTTTTIRLSKAGYQDFNTLITRNEKADVGAIIGGVFLLFPFLWTMKYKPMHNYVLLPETDAK